MRNLWIFILLTTAAWCQHTGVTVEENQTITGNKRLTGTTTIGLLCRSSQGEIDVVACYGADPTGTNDSTAALNAAFAAPSNSMRYIPPGVYKVSGTLHIDTRYKVSGSPGSGTGPTATVILAAPGFNGTLAQVVSSSVQSMAILGGMDGLTFDGQGHAGIGVLYGSANHNVSTFGYQTSNTVMHNFRRAGAQVTDETWELAFYNVGFQGNGGIGLEILDGYNMGENINCHGCDISNNDIGVRMDSATQGYTHQFSCYGCSFDYNATWGVQNQTATSGESILSIFGGQFETVGSDQRWIQNFGRATMDGVAFLEDTGSYPSFLIDNEGNLVVEGGRVAPNHAPTVLNPSQTGITTCMAALGLQAKCNNYIDPFGNTSGLDNLMLTGQLTANRLLQTKANTYAGKCTMLGSTTCTFTTAAGFKEYVSYVSIDQASTPPATAISAKCSLSGATATITAGTNNSLTWDCIFVGNPY